MRQEEFDKFADEYTALHAVNISASGEAPIYFADYKIRDLKRVMGERSRPAPAPKVLDFGAGVGTSVPFFRKHLPNAEITCVDVSVKSLNLGASRFGDDTRFVAFDGATLPFRDGSFGYAFAACVFHHIAQSEHHRLLLELRRVLVPGGSLMIYEHNPLNPLSVHAVRTCPFDENAILLPASAFRERIAAAGFRDLRVRYRVFFPRMLRHLRPLEDWLTWLPLGAQYYVCGVK